MFPLSDRYVLAADIGTSSLKAALIGLDGRLFAFARAVYPADNAGTGLEVLPAAAWEAAFERALSSLSQAAGRIRPLAVCVSGNGPTLVPVTEKGESLPPLYWHDSRVYIPENTDIHSYFLPRPAWFKRNRRAEYDRIRFFLSSHEWLSWRLGAEPFTALPHTAYTPIYWDHAQLAVFDLDAEKFPPFVKMGTFTGCVSEEAAPRLGLSAGTPIAAGASDFIAALIGTGTLEPGLACGRAGSSEGVNVCGISPAEGRGLRVLPHALEGLWNTGLVIPASGRLFDWYRGLTGQEGDYAPLLERLLSGPAREPHGAAPGVFPVFMPKTPGAFTAGGFSASAFVSAQEFPDRDELGRAVLETIGFQVRISLHELSCYGFPVGELRCSGGQCKNTLWNQRKADLCACSLLVPEIADAELAGDAVLAALALGEAADIKEGAGRMIRVKDRYDPDPLTAALYAERFDQYLNCGERFRRFLEGL
ncbi:MAG: FGGY-family carbohydrate kinase [Treponema sp.]|jgi:sugar (pentulose or hexulose) kinase|nr:FGGY-family carbohydrate kinase [Treponema sp.]